MLETFQQDELEDIKVNVTEQITSLIRQSAKLQELNHTIDDEYFITHTLAGFQRSMPAWLINQR